MAKTTLTKEIEFYKTIIQDCKIVFDAGCRDDNVFYDLNNDLEVHLFDPNNVNVEEELSDKPDVHFNNIALGNYIGETEFRWRYGSILHRTEEPKCDGIHDVRIVPITTIKSYCEERCIRQIDFLKIDTEGYDFEVIKGCGDLINQIKYIQFEDWEEGYFSGVTVKGIFDYFKGWSIYKMETSPVNYVVTKEVITTLKQVQ